MKPHPNLVFCFALLLTGGGIAAAAQQPLHRADEDLSVGAPVLTLEQAIRKALGQNPEAAAARASSQEARSDASLARTQLFPHLDFTEDISRGDDPVYVFGTRLRQRQFTQADFALNALNTPQPIGNFATRFSGSWTAFDSFKTQRQIHSADLMRKSADSSAQAVNQQIVLQVVKAYQSVLYAQREIAVARHEQETAAALLTSVDQHVKAGLAVESDRMSAEVNVAARKEDLIAAEGDLNLAWAELRAAMGAPHLAPSVLQPIEPRSFPPQTLDDALATAARTRPDLQAIGEAQSAEASTVGAARSAFGPQISTYGNWEEDRPTFAGSGGNNWVAGVRLSVDLLPLGKHAQLARERAAKERIDAQKAASELQVRLEVSRAYIGRQTAQLSEQTAQAALAQAAESLRIVRNRYNAGLDPITELLRAEDAERQSQTSYWRAVYGSAVAYAELLYATGTLTPEAAEVLQ
ncbi:MAG: TolC family protein [Terracidiphilus sp.]